MKAIRFFVGKRNGDAGQEFGTAFCVMQLPKSATEKYAAVFAETHGGWYDVNLVGANDIDEIMRYMQQRIDLGWFLEVDHPYSQPAVLWRLTSDTEKEINS